MYIYIYTDVSSQKDKKVIRCLIWVEKRFLSSILIENKMADEGGEFAFFRDIHITKG